jgi:hypothetical protein
VRQATTWGRPNGVSCSVGVPNKNPDRLVNTESDHGEIRASWGDRIDPAEWELYRRVIAEARGAGVLFAFGGAFATAVYTGELRNTKDFDFYIYPQDKEAMVSAITRAGLQDLYDSRSYDRAWIYRASAGEVIVDAIWAMANLRAQVDELWLTRGPEVIIHGERIRAIPIEELIWGKLYVLQKERSDWTDVFSLIDARPGSIEWQRLEQRLGQDLPLLAGALSVFSWLAPDRVQEIPKFLWAHLGLATPSSTADPDTARARAALLDSRPWFRLRDR